MGPPSRHCWRGRSLGAQRPGAFSTGAGAGREIRFHNEKAPDDAGALTSELAFGSVLVSSVLVSSVLGDDRTGPIEAVDQRGRDRLVPAVGADAVDAGRQVGGVGDLVPGL